MKNRTEKKSLAHLMPSYLWLEQQEYTTFLQKMELYTKNISNNQNPEAIWFCEHLPVYTTGKRGINNSLSQLNAPLVATERGGETTFHGTGQLMMYPMIRLKHYGLSVRDYVYLLEESCILLLAEYDIKAERNCGLPGVWVNHEKIAALGIRVSRGITSHGIALNVNTDLLWFEKINPCGTSRKTTTMTTQGAQELNLELISKQWFQILEQLLTTKLAEYGE